MDPGLLCFYWVYTLITEPIVSGLTAVTVTVSLRVRVKSLVLKYVRTHT